jgi:hypothetical protein
MSESKFTPGPWATDGCEIITEDYTTHIATAWSDTSVGRCVSRSEAIADARLIAAAPELLAACEAFIDADSQDGGSLAYVMAIEAIKKAKGKE